LLLFPFALVAVGLASREGSAIGAGQIIATIGGPFILLSAASAAGSLMLARRAEDRGLPAASADMAELGPPKASATVMREAQPLTDKQS
jgi:hypothetical protein